MKIINKLPNGFNTECLLLVGLDLIIAKYLLLVFQLVSISIAEGLVYFLFIHCITCWYGDEEIYYYFPFLERIKDTKLLNCVIASNHS